MMCDEVQSLFMPSEIRAVCSSIASVTTAGEGGSAMRGGLRSIESSMRGSSITGSSTLGASTLAGVTTTAARAVRLPVAAVGDEMGSLTHDHEKEEHAHEIGRTYTSDSPLMRGARFRTDLVTSGSAAGVDPDSRFVGEPLRA